MGTEPPIVMLLRTWFPDWEPPRSQRLWAPCLCPFHAETRASASISLELNAFTCHGCAMKGGIVGLIMRKEGLKFDEAQRYATEVLDGSYVEIPRKSTRKPSRRVFGKPRPQGERSKKVPSWRS